MDMYAEILSKALEKGEVDVKFPGGINTKDIVEGRCYAALSQIRDIIDDLSLDDSECLQKIEEIMRTLESQGISIGGRHDFG